MSSRTDVARGAAGSAAPPQSRPFQVGLLGHGTVGAAFARLLSERAEEIERFNGRRPVIGGVLTREDRRRRGYATIALDAAIHTLKEEGATDLGLLFCEPRHAPFYVARGWMPFEGEIFAEQPTGRIRFTATLPHVFDIRRKLHRGTIDLCGLPW